MKEKLKKEYEILIKGYIFLQPIIDLITSISINCFHLDLTLGIIIRTMFLILVMYATVFVYKKKEAKWYYLIVFIYFLLYMIGTFVFSNGNYLFAEIQGLIKTFYFPILLVSLYSMRKEININMRWLFATFTLYTMLIFIPNLLNIGFDSYQITKEGSNGLFNSANEIGGIISILTPLLFIYGTKIKGIIKKILFLIIYIIAILSIGTKTPIISLIMTTLLYGIWKILKYYQNNQHKKICILISIFAASLVSVLIIIPQTPFYKNIKVHMEFLQIENIGEVITKPELIDHFIFSQRLTFLKDKNNIYNSSNLYEKMIGIGYYNKAKEIKMVEMDYFDIYYSHGVLGFILFFMPYLYILRKMSRKMDKSKENIETYMNKVSILLILILSLFTGHIITAPAVSFIAICVIFVSEKKQLLITSYNLGYGGIERSLMTLLKNLDYSKYKVTLALEKKEGIYLNEIAKEITLIEYKASENKNVIIRKIINLTKRIKWILFNYKQYDASICYATYSLPCVFLTKTGSNNTIIFIHSNYKYVYNENENKLKEFFDNIKIESYSKIIFVSNESKNDLLEFYPQIKNKSYVINNLVDYSYIIEQSKKKIKIKKNKKTLLFVGRLEEKSKRISRIIEIANKFKNNENIEFWVIGDGPDKKYYESLIKKYDLDNIKMIGSQYNPYPYIKACDYLILTSDYEGFPVVYNEAIVLNKPILTTINVTDDFIDIQNRFGIVMKKDVDDIAEKIRQVLKKDFVVNEKVDFEKINRKRIAELEKMFDEVI